jgi:hypothetical protein
MKNSSKRDASSARAPPELNFSTQGPTSRVGINHTSGAAPSRRSATSRGDKEMLEYTQVAAGRSLRAAGVHDDATREFAYGPARGLPDVKLGAFPPALDAQAKQAGWTVVSMKKDWKSVFPAAPEVTASQ